MYELSNNGRRKIRYIHVPQCFQSARFVSGKGSLRGDWGDVTDGDALCAALRRWPRVGFLPFLYKRWT